MLKLLASMFLGAACCLAVTAADAARPSLEACGGAQLNRDEGFRDGRVVSRAMERRIEQFLQNADATPGAGVAIVSGDRIVYARGFGFRDLDTCEKAHADTRYYLKSVTKAFLGVAAAALHEEGAIDLDAPVSDYLPSMVLPEPLNAGQISLRSHFMHTQTYHNSGLAYRAAFAGNLPEAAYVEHNNRFARPKDTRFRYSNFGPVMGAHAIGTHLNSNWRDFIPEKVFAPAGMTNSFTSMAEAAKGPLAVSYTGASRKDYERTLTKTDAQMHAAGGAVSTAADLGRWVALNLNHGAIDGEQAVARHAIEQAHARQTQIDMTYSEYARFAHGLGFHSADYDGDLLLHHFGGESHFSFMPERGLGVAVLSNNIGDGAIVTHRLASTIYDALLGKSDLDARIERRLAEIEKTKQERARRDDERMAQLKASAPKGAHAIDRAALVGAYSDARLGEMRVSSGDHGLAVAFGDMRGPLTPIGADAYLAAFRPWGAPPVLFVFRKDEEGRLLLDWDGRVFLRRQDD